ncbi:MAG: TIGR03767 family metallophosphoesterase [Acidimicrobiia bacterium]|nr:TIGR03767 family metallophosphoesterase [Acidimicrobiia bacterium]
MTGLSRRRFMQVAGTIGASVGLPTAVVAELLVASPAAAATPGNTLESTVRVVRTEGRFRRLGPGPGEPFLVREDLGAVAAPERVGVRRSLLYLGQLSDTHVKDAQSPQAFEVAETLYLLGAGDAHRPQETLTTQVLDRMVAALRALDVSPVTGAPMAMIVGTGDITDIDGRNELRWFTDVMDGGLVTPDSGFSGRFDGPQSWPGVPWAYHPDAGPDVYAGFDYPRWPGLLDAAVAPFTAEGSAVPYYVVFGNHDAVWNGTLKRYWFTDMLATSNRMSVELGALASLLLVHGGPDASSVWRDRVSDHWNGSSRLSGTRRLPADAERGTLDRVAFMSHLLTESAETPGPRGHGFTDANVASGETWWSHDDGVVLHVGMDSCNHETGSNGSMGDGQYQWLVGLLAAHSSRYFAEDGSPVHNPSGSDRLIVVYSHHNSFTMDNTAYDPTFPGPRHFGGDIVALLLRHPNVVAWVNGHSHKNTILAHPNPAESGAGFWEINAASCIDFPQQNRVIEIVDNRDGTVSLFTVVVDHSASPSTDGAGFDVDGLAAISRELACNDPYGADIFERLRSGDFDTGDPFRRTGALEDRNAELLLKAPFDLSAIGDDVMEVRRLAAAGRIRAATP